MSEGERFGNCAVCGGRIYLLDNGEIDLIDCICDYIGRCGYPAFFSECRNAVGNEGCLGDPERQHPKCPAALEASFAPEVSEE